MPVKVPSPVALHLQLQVSGSLDPGATHRVRAQGRTLSGLLQTPEVPLPAPPVCLSSYLSAEKPQRPQPASKRITFPLDLNFLVLTVPEKRVISLQPKPFKHSFSSTSPTPEKVPGSRAAALLPYNFVAVFITFVLDFSTSSV